MKTIKLNQEVLISKEHTDADRDIRAIYTGKSVTEYDGTEYYHFKIVDRFHMYGTPTFDCPLAHVRPILNEASREALYPLLAILNSYRDEVKGIKLPNNSEIDLSCLDGTTLSDALETLENDVGEYHYLGSTNEA